MLIIRGVSPLSIRPGGRIQIGGNLGPRRSDYVVALAAGSPRPLVRHRLQIVDWDGQQLSAIVHDEVDPGNGYDLLILCNLTEGSRAAPVFKQCSNVVHLNVLAR
jgi:hypothetical protein